MNVSIKFVSICSILLDCFVLSNFYDTGCLLAVVRVHVIVRFGREISRNRIGPSGADDIVVAVVGDVVDDVASLDFGMGL